MYLNNKIIETLDDSDLSKFIKHVYKSVVLFDNNLKPTHTFNFTKSISLSSAVVSISQVPEYDIPLFRLLSVEDKPNRSVVLHYAKSISIYFDETMPNDESLVSYDYLLLFSYKTNDILTILNDDYYKLYEVLDKEKLLTPVIIELQKIILEHI